MEETSNPLPAAAEPDRWVESAVMDLGGPMFHAALLLSLREGVAADHVSHVLYGHDGQVRYSSSASLLNQSLIEWTTNVYVDDGFYRRDPNYALLRDMACQPERHPEPIIRRSRPSTFRTRSTGACSSSARDSPARFRSSARAATASAT